MLALELTLRSIAPVGVFGLAALFALDVAHSGRLHKTRNAGEQGPPFTLRSTEGKELSLADFRGRPVLVNLWATWCPACRAELPALDELARERPGCLAVVGIAVDSGGPGAVTEFVREHGLGYPVLVDDGTAGRAFSVVTIPRSVLIDADGRVVGEFDGVISQRQVRAAVAALPRRTNC